MTGQVTQLLRDIETTRFEEDVPELPWAVEQTKREKALERKCAVLEQRLAEEKTRLTTLRQQVASDDKGFTARRAEQVAVLQAMRAEIADRIVAITREHANDQAAVILDTLRALASTLR